MNSVLLFPGIAALSVTFFLAVKKKVTKEKLPSAPASLSVSDVTSGVVAEPDDAGFCGDVRVVLLFYCMLLLLVLAGFLAEYLANIKPVSA